MAIISKFMKDNKQKFAVKMEPRFMSNEQERDVHDLLEEQKQKDAQLSSGEEDHEDMIASSDEEAVVDDSSDEEPTK